MEKEPLYTAILGRGITPDGVLTLGSQQRAEAASSHYHEHRERYAMPGSRIVASGGHPMLDHAPASKSEALGMADIMVAAGVPSSLIHLEERSTSTIGNFLEMHRGGYFADAVISPTNPMTIITHKIHQPRAFMLARLVDDVPMRGYFAAGEDDLVHGMQEVAMTAAWRLAMLGVGRNSPAAAERRAEQITRTSQALRPVLKRIIRR